MKLKIKPYKVKILLVDIETFPNIGYSWAKYEQNIIDFIDNWYILCIGYKWLGGPTKVMALPDFKGYKPHGKDEELVKFIWELLNSADIVVAQNGDEFDFKKINTRFLYYGLTPPAPYKTIDTLKVARKVFAFNSNKLDDLGRDLEMGRKVENQGFPLWLKCERGDKKSWALMKKYCKKDVNLLEELYLKERPWISNHPNLDAFSNLPVCPRCGSGKIQNRGQSINQTFIYQRFQCQSCGGWGRYVKGKRNSEMKAI